MNKIEKFLKSLSKTEKELFFLLMNQLEKDFTKLPNIKKLKNTKNLYRIRIGKYRIIFKNYINKKTEIVRISKRDDQTYKNL